MSQPKITVEIKGSSANQDSLRKSDLIGGNFYGVLTASDAQVAALKLYVEKIQDGTDTSSVETAINAL